MLGEVELIEKVKIKENQEKKLDFSFIMAYN